MYAIGPWIAALLPYLSRDHQPPIELVDAQDAGAAVNMKQPKESILTIGPAKLKSQEKRERAGRELI